MLWLSDGVYHRKLGGLAEFAAEMNVAGETLLPVKMFGLLAVLPKPVKGKWSLPLGQPASQ